MKCGQHFHVVQIVFWKKNLFTFAFDEMQTILGSTHFQKVIRIDIWEKMLSAFSIDEMRTF